MKRGAREMMGRGSPELEQGLAHVGYELEMCILSVPRYAKAAHEQKDVVAANAFLECHLLHARNLIAFLIKDRIYKKDIHRTDYLNGWEPTPAEAERRLNDDYDDLHKRLAHLTWKRIEPREEGWHCLRIAKDVLAVMTCWHEALTTVDDQLANVLAPHLEQASNALTQAHAVINAIATGPAHPFGATGATGPVSPTMVTALNTWTDQDMRIHDRSQATPGADTQDRQ